MGIILQLSLSLDPTLPFPCLFSLLPKPVLFSRAYGLTRTLQKIHIPRLLSLSSYFIDSKLALMRLVIIFLSTHCTFIHLQSSPLPSPNSRSHFITIPFYRLSPSPLPLSSSSFSSLSLSLHRELKLAILCSPSHA